MNSVAVLDDRGGPETSSIWKTMDGDVRLGIWKQMTKDPRLGMTAFYLTAKHIPAIRTRGMKKGLIDEDRCE